jgi:hypothetical protein
MIMAHFRRKSVSYLGAGGEESNGEEGPSLSGLTTKLPGVGSFSHKSRGTSWPHTSIEATRFMVGFPIEGQAYEIAHVCGAMRALGGLGGLGAKMVSTIEISNRFRRPSSGHHLVYACLPRLPESPGAFSEAQLRWINGHFPEDFAMACRAAMAKHAPS